MRTNSKRKCLLKRVSSIAAALYLLYPDVAVASLWEESQAVEEERRML